MELYRIGESGLKREDPGDLPPMAQPGSFTWLDLLASEAEAPAALAAMGISVPLIEIAIQPTVVPQVKAGPRRVALRLHSLDEEGHLIQTTYLIGTRDLVTVQTTFAPLPEDVVRRDPIAVTRAIAAGKARAESPAQLAQLMIEHLVTWLEDLLQSSARKAGALDRRLREGETGDPVDFLEETFSVRHELLTVSNRASQSREACGTVDEIVQDALGLAGNGFQQLSDRFARLRTLCDGEKEFLQGVLDFYESHVNTKMNIAMERLAVIAAVALPVTAIGGILGMNTIVASRTSVLYTTLLLVFMTALALVMLRWAKKQGWW